MNVTIQVMGLKQAQKQLADQGKKVDGVLRGALNSTATKGRTERYVKPMSKLFKSSVLGSRLGNADVRGKLTIKRARRGRMNSRIIPSSSGVRVDDYRRWIFEVLAPTRARLYVYGLRGRKVAAGFVNPASSRQAPLSTRNSKTTARGKTYARKKALSAAIGPSTAYWFKQLTTSQTLRWTSDFLQQEFAKRMQLEIDKGVR
ncbi:hypothetical protein [Pseudomonas sp.]|uniref:hypothetical protein n=1 Tax=Pseudomonas sp. TaxID=306 RepID=UPI00272F3537|nr:hypothetical protein [Pseudomonas sp.]MDP2446594.1 hypothetical protein [Pseudomonas sp.]MDZ4334280.1 hypothetical protein [Pseudomonas sp.]